MYWFGIGEESG